MQIDRVHALATAVIAFVTVLGIMGGIYYNLHTSGLRLGYIMILELLFIFAVAIFISWINGGLEHG